MRKFVIFAASLTLAIGSAMAADKVEVKQVPKAVKLTDVQMATKVAGDIYWYTGNSKNKCTSGNFTGKQGNGAGYYYSYC